MQKPIYILGISCYYHDSAAVLLKDGEIIFAAQEERFTRKKHDQSFPKNTIEQALNFAGITIDNISAVGFYEKPFTKFFDRMLRTFFKTWPRGYVQYLKAMQAWMKEKLWIPQQLKKDLKYHGDVSYVQHHESHAASSFFCSGFSDAAIVTVDGVGEWATATIGKGEGGDFHLIKEIHYPHSLGLLYSAITYYLGFKVNSAEYKVMGLAPYGEPKYVEQIRELIDIKDDGSFKLKMKYFSYEHGMRMTGKKLEKLLGQKRRKPEAEIEQFHKDVARSVQEVTEEVMMKIVRHAKELTGSDYLCLAGGVALNCVANGKILRSGIFKDIFVQPASGDAGGALGVAKAIWHRRFTRHAEEAQPLTLRDAPPLRSSAPQGDVAAPSRSMTRLTHASFGSSFTNEEIESVLRTKNIPFQKLSDDDLIQTVAALLEGTNVIGWFQGRMEYGPRALGNRSIIADARNKENWQKVNLKIKFRESFRPFAPTALEERASDYFDLDRPSPFMLLVADVHPDKREKIPAVTHVDGSARIQTINREQNPKYYDLIKEFEKKTGCSVIINTSFNVRGEPIVCTPEDALNCFLNTHMDFLVIENCLIKKDEMLEEIMMKSKEYLEQFELD